MFLALRNKLAVYDSYINPFHRRGALRLSRYHPNTYLLLTLLAAAGGYLFLFLFPVLLVSMPVALYFSLPAATTSWQWALVSTELVLGLLGATGTVCIATMRFTPPSGLQLDKRHFNRLFELLKELGDIYGNPRIDRVVLRDRFDVRIVKTPRSGFSFTTNHTLVIGLPLLLTLSALDVHALVARRVGQLAGKDSRVNSWLYYLRDMWVQYLQNFESRKSWLAQPLRAFFRWYVPRYRALSLGAARWSELNADQYSIQAINDRDAVRAICGQAMVNDYLSRVFWPEVVECAKSSMKPGKMPHARMAELFRDGLPTEEKETLLKRVAARRSNPGSTMPSLNERLENLGHRKPLPLKTMTVSAAQFYLGNACEQCIKLIDKRSCQKVREKVIEYATKVNR
jgi:Zn-dependent protease with chaperone function